MQRLFPYLPKNIVLILSKLSDKLKKEACELRLRVNGVMSVSTYRKNLFLTPSGQVTQRLNEAYVCTLSDITTTVVHLTEGSVYRYMNSINSGYIVTREGIRAGIAGEAVYNGSAITSVADFSSLNIRIPHYIEGSGDDLLKFIKENPETSVLLFSPSGYGKTTVIRSVAQGIAAGKYFRPRRVSVIDERGEILPEGSQGLADRFLGYTKPDGIEIAVRLFSPEYIICDEIGLSDDTQAILSVQNTGVPFIATTHGKSIEEIMMRPNIRTLVDHGVFRSFARLERCETGCRTIFEERIP